MNIVEFLLARITEDEKRAHYYDPLGASIGPARLLAECQAKRAIIERETSQRTYEPGTLPNVETTYRHDGRLIVHTPDGGELLEGPEVDEWLKRYTEPVTDTPTLRDLATMYADHPDYRDEWKP